MRYLLLLLFLLPQVICAQRAYKPVRSDLKAKNYKEAVNKLEALKKDTVQNLRDEPQTALYLIEAYRGLNDQENVKLYLHQPYDTTAFFSTTYRIVSEAVRLDSLERLKVAQSGGRLKSAALVRDLVQRYFPNILAASSFYYFSRRFEKAMPFLRMSLDLPRHPVGVMAALNSRHDTVNAVRYTSSAYILGLDDEVKRYSEMALADPAARPTVIEWMAETARKQENTASRLHWLKTGWKEYPWRHVFFTSLVDYYSERGDLREVERLATRQLAVDTATQSALLARSIARLGLEDFDGCISDGEKLLRRDSTQLEITYYIGAAYLAKAHQAAPSISASGTEYRKAKTLQKEFYRKAETAFESYRKEYPERRDRWAPMLYKVYLALNEGKKFAEIERILQEERK